MISATRQAGVGEDMGGDAVRTDITPTDGSCGTCGSSPDADYEPPSLGSTQAISASEAGNIHKTIERTFTVIEDRIEARISGETSWQVLSDTDFYPGVEYEFRLVVEAGAEGELQPDSRQWYVDRWVRERESDPGDAPTFSEPQKKLCLALGETGDTFTNAFEKAGDYNLRCRYRHDEQRFDMDVQVVVGEPTFASVAGGGSEKIYLLKGEGEISDQIFLFQYTADQKIYSRRLTKRDKHLQKEAGNWVSTTWDMFDTYKEYGHKRGIKFTNNYAYNWGRKRSRKEDRFCSLYLQTEGQHRSLIYGEALPGCVPVALSQEQTRSYRLRSAVGDAQDGRSPLGTWKVITTNKNSNLILGLTKPGGQANKSKDEIEGVSEIDVHFVSGQNFQLGSQQTVQFVTTADKAADIDDTGQTPEIKRSITFEVMADLNVDSDNANGLEGSVEENRIENAPEKPGMIVRFNDADVDSDGIPDFADGFDRWEGDRQDDRITRGEPLLYPAWISISEDLDPSKVTLRFKYSGSPPEDVKRKGNEKDGYTYSLLNAPDEGGSVRLWRRNGCEARKGHYLAPDSPVEFDSLDKVNGAIRKRRIYLEGIHKGRLQIIMDVDPNADESAGYVETDAVRVNVDPIDIDTEIDGENGPDGYDYDDDGLEETGSALLVLNDDYDRYKQNHEYVDNNGRPLRDRNEIGNEKPILCAAENDLKKVRIVVPEKILNSSGRFRLEANSALAIKRKYQDNNKAYYGVWRQRDPSNDGTDPEYFEPKAPEWKLPEDRELLENLWIYVEGLKTDSKKVWGTARLEAKYSCSRDPVDKMVKVDEIQFTVLGLGMDYVMGRKQTGHGAPEALNKAPNPAVIVREELPDNKQEAAKRVARFLTYPYVVKSEGGNEWREAFISSAPSGGKGEQIGPDWNGIEWSIHKGPVSFFEADGQKDNTGVQARLYGDTSGQIDDEPVEIKVKLRGADEPFFSYHCVAGPLRRYPMRCTFLLRDPLPDEINRTNAQVPILRNAIKWSNMYLRQVGVEVFRDPNGNLGDNRGDDNIQRYYVSPIEEERRGIFRLYSSSNEFQQRTRPVSEKTDGFERTAHEAAEYNALPERINIVFVQYFSDRKTLKGQAQYGPENDKGDSLTDQIDEGGFENDGPMPEDKVDMRMLETPINQGNTHRYMAAVLARSTTLQADNLGANLSRAEWTGMVMAHEIGHCFGLLHRGRESNGDEADGVSVKNGPQLPGYGRLLLSPKGCGGRFSDLQNLMHHGYSQAGQTEVHEFDKRKGDLDLLQAAGMRGVPANPQEWKK